jgi:hypothetical protein
MVSREIFNGNFAGFEIWF